MATTTEQTSSRSGLPRRRGKAQKSLDLIEAAREILAEIQPASVRAVCYRLFAAGHIENMGKAEVSRAGGLLLDAREQAMIPWEWIVDHTRTVRTVPQWDQPAELIECAVEQYRKDYWTLQPSHVEVWCEKATVLSTIDPVLRRYGVPSRMMTGFGGATAVRNAADFAVRSPKPCVALYIGDWDPSGLYMSERDLPGRLEKYTDCVNSEWEIQRIALNAMDVNAGDVPSFPARDKLQDPRADWYQDAPVWDPVFDAVAEWDRSRCWEVDALSPVLLRDRVETAIRLRLDDAAWERCARTEASERESLQSVLGAWKGISDTMLLDAVKKLSEEPAP